MEKMPAAFRLNGVAGFLFEAEMAIDEGLEFHYFISFITTRRVEPAFQRG